MAVTTAKEQVCGSQRPKIQLGDLVCDFCKNWDYCKEFVMPRVAGIPGRPWLVSPGGQVWLVSPGGHVWLVSPGGHVWLVSLGGHGWYPREACCFLKGIRGAVGLGKRGGEEGTGRRRGRGGCSWEMYCLRKEYIKREKEN